MAYAIKVNGTTCKPRIKHGYKKLGTNAKEECTNLCEHPACL
jgi:hypothetical protein